MTNDTMPWHIWLHETQLASHVSTEGMTVAMRSMMQRAYHAGEPVWMAADALKQLAKGAQRAAREVDDGRDIVRRAAACGVIIGTSTGFAVYGGSK